MHRRRTGHDRPHIGVLALQGDFAAHLQAVIRAGGEAREVKTAAEIAGCDGIILPGGESTVLLKLMEGSGIEAALLAFHASGGVLFGTCAGMILLARGVLAPRQRSLGLMDLDVERNSYGRQIDSFEIDASWIDPGMAGSGAGMSAPLRCVFIRAPRIRRLGPGVRTLVAHGDEPVLVREGRCLAGAFHPELTDDPRVHAYFLSMAAAEAGQGKGRSARNASPAMSLSSER